MIRPAAGVLALLLVAGCATSSAGASCAGPNVTVTPATFAAGDRVRIEGEFFFDDCYDTGQPGTPPATRDIELRLVTPGASSRAFVLTTVDAARDGSVDTTVAIPDDVPPGPARIEGAFSQPADVVVTAP